MSAQAEGQQVQIPESRTALVDAPVDAGRRETMVAASVSAIADPGPLGLAAFAMTTFVLSVFNANIIKTGGLELVVLPLALFYGGFSQLLAGMWEFKKANTFGALAFTSYGAFWLSFAGYVKYIAPHLPAAQAYEATGLYLLAWAIFTAYMTVAAVRVSGAVLAVFVALTVTFALLTWGALGQSAGITHAGGYLGLVTAALAWYASFAGVTNATWRRIVLPTFPLAR
jgi:succinate-acetate transporter protein